ncbi:MAG: flavin reductase [Selenomonas noxia]
MHQRIERFGFYYGFPVFFMTTKDRATGADDLTPLSSSWTLGNTMVIGIGQGNKGFQNLEEGAEATFSVPDDTLYEQLKHIEKTTGVQEPVGVKKELGYTYCPDKFAAAGLTRLPGETVRTVRVAECPIHIETVVESITPKDWFAVVVCRITAIFVSDELLRDGRIDTAKWRPLIYKFKEYTTTGKRIGLNFGFSEY